MKFVTSIYSFLSDNSYLLPIGVILITLVLLYLTLVPSNMLGHYTVWSYDKLGHMLLFGSWCISVGLYYQIRKTSPASPWFIFFSGAIFGLLIEVLQYSLPFQRDPDPFDFLFDVIGCLIAVWVLKKTQPKIKD